MEPSKEPIGLALFKQYNDLMDSLMNYDNPSPVYNGTTNSPTDLYVFHTYVEDLGTETTTGKTYIKLEGIATRFWVSNPVTLKPQDRVKIMFYQETQNE